MSDSRTIKFEMQAGGPARFSNVRIKEGRFFADIICDGRSEPPIFHYVIQRRGSAEILHWSQATSMEAAEQAARTHMAGLVRFEREMKVAAPLRK